MAWTRRATRCSRAATPRCGSGIGRPQRAFSSSSKGPLRSFRIAPAGLRRDSGTGWIYPSGEIARSAGLAIVLERPADRGEGKLLPRDLFPPVECDLQALLSRLDRIVEKPGTVDEL